MATPGYGVGDVIAVSALAWKMYRAYKDAPEEFQIMSNEILSLHAVLKEVEENNELLNYAKELEIIQKGCEDVLKELEDIHCKYEASVKPGGSRHIFDRVKFGNEDIAGLRARVVLNTSLLTVFNSTAIARSQGRIEASQAQLEACASRIERKLDRLCRRASMASITSLASFATLKSKEVWKNFFRDLHHNGFKPEVLTEANREQFLELFEKRFLNERTNTGQKNAMVSPASSTETSGASMQNMIPESQQEETSSKVSALETSTADKCDESLSSLASSVVEDPKQTWMQLYSELSVRGISAEMITQNRDRLIDAVKTTMENNDGFEEIEVSKAGTNSAGESGWSGALALHGAARTGRTRLVRLLLDMGVPVDTKLEWNKTSMTALNLAAYGGHIEITKMLLAKGADIEHSIHDGDTTSLIIAVDGGHTDLAKVLLEHGAKLEYSHSWRKETALHAAVCGRFVASTVPSAALISMIDLLLAHGAHINSRRDDGATPLHCAVEHGKLALVELLIKRNANIFCTDDNGFTLLHVAKLSRVSNRNEIIQFLQNKYPELDYVCGDNEERRPGLTPMHYAAWHGDHKTIQQLSKQGGIVDDGTSLGPTPLMFAVAGGHLEVTQTLLDGGANVGANLSKDWIFECFETAPRQLRQPLVSPRQCYFYYWLKAGDTPLHIAVMKSNSKMIDLLRRYGASISIRNEDNNTPLDYARSYAEEYGTVYGCTRIYQDLSK